VAESPSNFNDCADRERERFVEYLLRLQPERASSSEDVRPRISEKQFNLTATMHNKEEEYFLINYKTIDKLRIL